ncbi:Serine/threonine-protein phosphatase 2B catalytic subunit [Aduncisulcus paluster]|uniref:Serine/threonine-protein phosphatase n=1 Tax=Aduncisulcus paluster TaxID=2918883 RepID=A0ABQ5K2S6_9EUKA|nr:Serine/threonine-protein phosphatase 2B catalytic subunit [Aduncisulcus paluster]
MCIVLLVDSDRYQSKQGFVFLSVKMPTTSKGKTSKTHSSDGLSDAQRKMERVHSEIPFPVQKRLSLADFPGCETDISKIDLKAIRAHFEREGRLSRDFLKFILTQATKKFKELPNIVKINSPICIVGDIHGQYYDLLQLLDIGKWCPAAKYLFLGDYVDRGTFGVECFLTLALLYLQYPEHIMMLRGNHESAHMTKHFNFCTEVCCKYDEEIYEMFLECFYSLPLCAVVDKKMFCVHGGISPKARSLSDISKIFRFVEYEPDTALDDLLWSDPAPDGYPSSTRFIPNTQRGTASFFGRAAMREFLSRNHLLCIIRGHEVEEKGFRMRKVLPGSAFPPCITVFSAPAYCDLYANKAAFLDVGRKHLHVRTFDASPHPYVLPSFQNVLSWSFPFVVENMYTLLRTLYTTSEEVLGEEEVASGEKEAVARRIRVIRKKIAAVAMMQQMAKTLREENQAILQLKGLASGRLPRGLLRKGPAAIREALSKFQTVAVSDRMNEMSPRVDESEFKKMEEELATEGALTVKKVEEPFDPLAQKLSLLWTRVGTKDE